MATVAVQVDNQNNNTTAPQSVATICTDGSAKLYLAWQARNADTTNGVYFRTYDIATFTLGPVITVVATGAFLPQMVRLANGRLILVFQTGSVLGQVKATESADEGSTWSAPITVDANATNILGAIGAYSNQAYVCFKRSNSGYEAVRTGVDTWGAPVQFFAGASNNTFTFTANAPRSLSVGATRRCLLVNRNGPGSFSTLKVNSFSYDGLAWADVNIFTGTVSGARNPKVHRGTDGATRGAFIGRETGDKYPKLFKTANDVDFTIIGTPAPFKDYNWDPSNPHSVAADARDIWFVATTIYTLGNYLDIYKGQDSLDGWTRIERFSMPWTTTSSSGGDALFVGKDLFTIGHYVSAGAYHVFLSRTEDVGSDPPPPPDPGYTSGRRFVRGTLRVTGLPDGEVAVAPYENEREVREVVEV